MPSKKIFINLHCNQHEWDYWILCHVLFVCIWWIKIFHCFILHFPKHLVKLADVWKEGANWLFKKYFSLQKISLPKSKFNHFFSSFIFFSQPSQRLAVKDASDWPSKKDISGWCLTTSVHQCLVRPCWSGGGKVWVYFIFFPQTNHSNWVLHGVHWKGVRIQKNSQRAFIKFLSHKATTFPSKSYFLQPMFWVAFHFQDFLCEMVIQSNTLAIHDTLPLVFVKLLTPPVSPSYI